MTQAKQILLVDDQADAIDALAMLLELDGYTVRTAYSGADALAAIETFIPDLALIDVSMPNMNGMQLARLLRHNAALANTRLIALTGFGGDAERKQAAEAGFDAHMTKPVSADQLTQLIEGTGD
ncbi:response regulator [Paraburkholderia phenazinium]|jgi:CheY-like chemotaxis protein|uniref:Response regulator receiver domain-containing protein n=1 Tax=Paraburkholderia phenazinium TaxID=60549 RepID=A0A1G7X881_9BURK|nr:response regulator [Paraburkholderia phenazinium]SDG80382.1 Response regulator receiver domain-containing protein [Paraburkholderia phenazinium]